MQMQAYPGDPEIQKAASLEERVCNWLYMAEEWPNLASEQPCGGRVLFGFDPNHLHPMSKC